MNCGRKKKKKKTSLLCRQSFAWSSVNLQEKKTEIRHRNAASGSALQFSEFLFIYKVAKTPTAILFAV